MPLSSPVDFGSQWEASLVGRCGKDTRARDPLQRGEGSGSQKVLSQGTGYWNLLAVLIRVLLFPETVAQGGPHGHLQVDLRCHQSGNGVVAGGVVYFEDGFDVPVGAQGFQGCGE